jgi:hypothetical protein
MQIRELTLNPIQLAKALLNAREEYDIGGRGVGKTRYMGYKMQRCIEHLPGASCTITAQTYSHLLTGILPSALAQLEAAGYLRDIHYAIGTKPPRSWGLPFEPPVKNFEHYITFYNKVKPVGFHLFSQDREGGSRGFNTDFEFVDEFLTINRERYAREVSATNRANKDRFDHIPWHNGKHFSSSMPYSKEGKEILKKADYYLTDYGINYVETWKRIVNLQLQLLDIDKPADFAALWNEIQRLRKQILPRLDKSGQTLFTFSNAFDNLEFVKLSYIKDNQRDMPYLIFLIEIMNQVLDVIEDCFYNLQSEKQVYWDSFDNDFIQELALTSHYDFKKLGTPDCRYDSKKYYHPDKPLILMLDWGGGISYCAIGQQIREDEWETLYCHKEFFVKPPGEMVKRLMEKVCDYYRYHTCRDIFFVRDKFGDDRTGLINSSLTYNEEAMRYLARQNWRVQPLSHSGKEPPYHIKWMLMNNILNENDPKFLRLRINGNNCKFLKLSMENTKVKERDGKIIKDKRDERRKNVPQEEAQHPGDALDKCCYAINGKALTGSSSGGYRDRI